MNSTRSLLMRRRCHTHTGVQPCPTCTHPHTHAHCPCCCRPAVLSCSLSWRGCRRYSWGGTGGWLSPHTWAHCWRCWSRGALCCVELRVFVGRACVCMRACACVCDRVQRRSRHDSGRRTALARACRRTQLHGARLGPAGGHSLDRRGRSAGARGVRGRVGVRRPRRPRSSRWQPKPRASLPA
jgi:hypothetical protein